MGPITKMVEKLGASTTVANKATWPATVRRTNRHLQEENVENQDQARLEENSRRRPKKHLRRPVGGGPREELNFATSTNKPEENTTLGSVNVEGTEPEHATLFTVCGGTCARRDDSFDSRVELLIDCGATSDFMSMQTAKMARLPLYKLTNPGHVFTAGGVQVEVRYYTRAYVRVGELVF